jgi:hypothetical protein
MIELFAMPEIQILGALLLAVLAAALLWSRRSRKIVARNHVVVDGSNVMYWKGGEPDIATVKEVLDHLKSLGATPGVMFDANAGYLIVGKYQHDRAFAQSLGIPENRVLVVSRGTPADPTILQAARDYKGRVVSNDRFRDWAQEFPEVTHDGFLIQGGYRKGALWLEYQVDRVA